MSSTPAGVTLLNTADLALSRGLRARERLRDLAPAMLLVATLGGAAIVHFSGGAAGGQVHGFAQTSTQTVASIEPGRVSAILVSVGDRVEPGQVVATLDTGTIDAEIALDEARRKLIEAEIRAEQALLAQRMDEEIEGLQRERARHREEHLRVRAEANVLDGEVARVKRLVSERQAVLDDLTQLGLRQAGATALAEAKPRTIGVLSKQIEQAEQRRRAIDAARSMLAEKLAAALNVAEQRIELLRRRRDGYSLRAGRGGKVSSISRRPGDVVESGNSVVQIVTAEDRVIACVIENTGVDVHQGDGATLRTTGGSGAVLRGKALALGPMVAELPARCWPSPKVPVWGQEITIAIDPPTDLLPGQAFEITFVPAHRQVPGPASTASPTTALASPILIPAALSARTRMEPSGLLADPASSRYVLVSDDTGRDGDAGETWLFAMSAAGEIEADPLPVHGVPELNDAEAIAAGPAGEVYLLSSQSYSKKGKRKPSRTALLRLHRQQRGFDVDGEVHLAEALDADPDLAATLGLANGTRALDVEGIAVHEGALYLGVKAPLDAKGAAMIWRVATPAVLFSGGAGEDAALTPKRLRDAGLAPWATVNVGVEVGGQPVAGGISELLFLEGGALVLASTPSTAAAEAGALWVVDKAGPGPLEPRLLERFTDLKPEGIAPSLVAGKLMVVFDTGDRAPVFREIAWSP